MPMLHKSGEFYLSLKLQSVKLA